MRIGRRRRDLHLLNEDGMFELFDYIVSEWHKFQERKDG
jgi:hypothetical protein